MANRRSKNVVYPVHGIAEIVGRETRMMAGRPTAYVVLFVAGEHDRDDLKILVQRDRFDELGIRPAMSTAVAKSVLDTLAVPNPRMSTVWARRYKNHQGMLKSGDVFDLAEVVRNLTVLQRTKILGAAEKELYRQARSALVAELAVTWGTSKDSAADRVDQALNRDCA